MFFCENCGKQVERNQPINKVVTKRRKVSYQNIRRRKRKIEEDIKETYGWEIAKEIDVCPVCYIAITGKRPKRRDKVPPRHSKRTKYKHELRQPARFVKSEIKKPEVEIVTSLPLEKG